MTTDHIVLHTSGRELGLLGVAGLWAYLLGDTFAEDVLVAGGEGVRPLLVSGTAVSVMVCMPSWLSLSTAEPKQIQSTSRSIKGKRLSMYCKHQWQVKTGK